MSDLIFAENSATQEAAPEEDERECAENSAVAKAHRIDLAKDTCIYKAARRLLAAGAKPTDAVEGWRGGMLCLTGMAGELAEWTVSEHDHGLPTFSLRRWMPFPTGAIGSSTAETPPEATAPPCAD